MREQACIYVNNVVCVCVWSVNTCHHIWTTFLYSSQTVISLLHVNVSLPKVKQEWVEMSLHPSVLPWKHSPLEDTDFFVGSQQQQISKQLMASGCWHYFLCSVLATKSLFFSFFFFLNGSWALLKHVQCWQQCHCHTLPYWSDDLIDWPS